MTEQGKYYMATSKSTTAGFQTDITLFPDNNLMLVRQGTEKGRRRSLEKSWLVYYLSYEMRLIENHSKPTILTATNDINNQKTTIHGEIFKL